MKTVPLTIRRCPQEIHKALKRSAKTNHRSLNNEVLARLEREAEEPPPLKGAELARHLREARKLMTETEHRKFAADIERGIKVMRGRERPFEP